MEEASDMSFPLTRVPCGAQGQSVEEAGCLVMMCSLEFPRHLCHQTPKRVNVC